MLSLPALTTITGGGNGGCSYAQFEALSGGDVELRSLTTISGGAIWVESDGTGSVLDAPVLTAKLLVDGRQVISRDFRLPTVAHC